MASERCYTDFSFDHLISFSLEDEVKELEEEISLELNAVLGVIKPPTQTVLNGHLLPICARGKVLDNYAGVALKEISSEYKNKNTFVVIGRGSRILYRFGDAKTFAKANGSWRNTAISILTHGVFNYFMIFAIILNCFIYGAIPYGQAKVTLTTFSETDSGPAPPPSPEDEMNYALAIKFTNVAFVALFVIEFTLKVLARGLFKTRNPFCCLQISWSWLDLFVIVNGILSILNPANRTLAALNTFRTLKLIPLIPSWLGGYDLLLKRTWQRLLHVGIFGVVVMFMLGLISMELYHTSLRNKCILNTTATEIFESDRNFTDQKFLTYADSDDHLPCGNMSWNPACPSDYICVDSGENPQHGYVGFETLGLAELNLFNLVFQDFAEYVYEKIWLIHTWLHIIYSMLVFLLGTFLVGVLVYAVLGREFLEGFSRLKLELETKYHQDNSAVWSRRFEVTPSGHWGKWRENGRQTVMHKNFDLFITFFILMDVVTFALDHHGIEEGPKLEILIWMNQIIYVVYVLECFLKVLFIGIKPYMRSYWNRFDFLMALWIILRWIFAGTFLTAGIVFTVLKVVPRWPVLNFLFNIIGTGIWTRWIFGINAIAMFIFSYMGYVTFGDSYTTYAEKAGQFPPYEIPRWNMVDFWQSFRFIFRSFAGEWIETLWELQVVAPGFPSIAFVACSGIVGNFLVTCLSLCIVLTTVNQLQQQANKHRKHTSLERIFYPLSLLCHKIERKITGEGITDKETEENEIGTTKGITEAYPETAENTEDKAVNGKEEEANIVQPTPEPERSKATMPEKIMSHYGYKLWVCSLIIALTILVAYEQIAAEITFICYFSLDIIARAALRGWGVGLTSLGLYFDSLMVINSVVALSTKVPYGIWNFGTFRLLMIISRVTGLQLVRNELWRQIRALWQYLVATMFLWFSFTLIGMKLFKGGFSKCFDGERGMDFTEIQTKSDCLTNNLTWLASRENFDSVNDGLWTLFLVATRNGWINSITSAEDMTQVDGQPNRGAYPTAMIYYMVFLVFGVLFPFSVIIGVLLEKFKKKSWIQIFGQGWQHDQKPKPDTSTGSQSALEKVVASDYFELCVCVVILVDCVLYACSLSYPTQQGIMAIQIIRIIILFLFIIELILRGVALKKTFIKSWLNWLLVVVVVLSLVDAIMVELEVFFISAGLIRVLRLFHLLALDHLGSYKIPEFGSFRKSLKHSFPVLSCILTFYGLLYASFASFGVTYFTGIEDFASWNATTSLFKIATTSGMEGVYYKIANGGNCVLAMDDVVCGHPRLGIYYVVGFLALTVFCFVNLYLALILETTEQLGKSEQKCEAGYASENKDNGKLNSE